MKNLKTTIFVLLSIFLINSKSFAQTYCQDTNANADVVILMDLTGSNTAANITEQKAAVLAFIDSFNAPSVTTKPFIAVGSFNHNCKNNGGTLDCTGDPARILVNGNLTDDYGAIGGTPDLMDAVNSVAGTGIFGRGLGGTNIAAAIQIAQQELALNGSPSRPDYIVLISDGNPNLPGFATNPACTSCICSDAEDAADTATVAAEAATAQIFAVHYKGAGVTCVDEGGETAGAIFMRSEIASKPSFYYNALTNIVDIFKEIAQDLTCQSTGNACSIPFCDTAQNPAVCSSVPNTTDTDGDGIPDCTDQCPGANDNQLGGTCSAGIGACQRTGSNICTGGTIQCNAVAGTGSAEICDGVDNNCNGQIDENNICCVSGETVDNSIALDNAVAAQKNVNNKALNRLKNAAEGNSKQIAAAKKLLAETEKLYMASWQTSWALPQSVTTCSTSGVISTECANVKTFTDEYTAYDANSQRLFEILQEALKRLKQVRGKKKGDKTLEQQGISARKASVDALSAAPKQTNLCN